MTSLAALSLGVTARTQCGKVSCTALDRQPDLTGPVLASTRLGRPSHRSSSDTAMESQESGHFYIPYKLTWLEYVTGHSHVSENIKILTGSQDWLHVVCVFLVEAANLPFLVGL